MNIGEIYIVWNLDDPDEYARFISIDIIEGIGNDDYYRSNYIDYVIHSGFYNYDKINYGEIELNWKWCKINDVNKHKELEPHKEVINNLFNKFFEFNENVVIGRKYKLNKLNI